MTSPDPQVFVGGARSASGEEERNVAAVIAFYQAGLNEKDFDKAARYLGDRYIQHNPKAKDGVEGFRAFVETLRDKTPDRHSEIKRAFGVGDHVILHVHARTGPDDPGEAIVDIFRLEGGRIVEHWDAIQPVPGSSANGNGMF